MKRWQMYLHGQYCYSVYVMLTDACHQQIMNHAELYLFRSADCMIIVSNHIISSGEHSHPDDHFSPLP
jgi:hypothetical protein